jgi:RUN domain
MTLVQRLNAAMKPLLAAASDSASFTEDWPAVKVVLSILEQVLADNLKSVAIFRATTGFDFLENSLAKCMPNVDATLKRVRSIARTGNGRLRVFLRLALNEGALADYISALAWNQELTKSYYGDAALLRDDEQLSILLMLLVTLKSVTFRIRLDDPALDRDDYWSGFDEQEVMRSISNAAATLANNVVAGVDADRAVAVQASSSSSDKVLSPRAPSSRSGRKKRAKVAAIGSCADVAQQLEKGELAERLVSSRQAMLKMEIELEKERQKRAILSSRFDLLKAQVDNNDKYVASLLEEMEMWKSAAAASTSTAVAECSATTSNGSSNKRADVVDSPQLLATIDAYFSSAGDVPLDSDENAQSESTAADPFVERLERVRRQLAAVKALDQRMLDSLNKFTCC